MEIIYDLCIKVAPREYKRVATSTKISELYRDYQDIIEAAGEFYIAANNQTNGELDYLRSKDEVEGYIEAVERAIQWKPMSNLLEDSPESTPKAVEATVEKPLSEMNTQKVIELLDTLTPIEEPKVFNSNREKLPKVESVVVKDHINPSHYQSYFGGMDMEELQWLEAKQYQNHWREPENFKAAVMLQADKYQSRMGGKDGEAQELLKAVWYLKFLAAYIKNGNKPIRVKDIQSILGE